MKAQVIDGGAFYAGGSTIREEAPEERAAICIDWRRQRDVLERLRAGHTASFQAFDWEAFDGSFLSTDQIVSPQVTTIPEGTYSARPNWPHSSTCASSWPSPKTCASPSC